MLCLGLNLSFKEVSRVLFGREIGELEEFSPYLEEMLLPYQMKKSAVSGRQVMVSNFFYPQGAKFISQEELSALKTAPFSVNDIKDIDSLFAAASESMYYCGNKLFGANQDVTEADNCVDSSGIFHAHNVYRVKNGAYLSHMREAENVFGVSAFPGAESCMRMCEGVGAKRCFESFYGTSLADTYYAFNCIGCSDCMFAFNLRSRRNIIGNLELPRDEYLRPSASSWQKLRTSLQGKSAFSLWRTLHTSAGTRKACLRRK
ncbi:Uncharacterised protein [uncultured archaeon]|nr:Uncharacterised protein [uncultured archaeon]